MTEALAEPGSPTQLPRGEATDIQRQEQQTVAQPGIQPLPEEPTAVPSQPTFQPVNAIRPEAGPTFRPSTPEDKFLFGPTQHPSESVFAGIAQSQQLPVPQAAYDILPALQQAALSPDAPPQIQALLDLINYHSGR